MFISGIEVSCGTADSILNWRWVCRRRRAKQRQERLMKEFASKQKQFMEKVVGVTGVYIL